MQNMESFFNSNPHNVDPLTLILLYLELPENGSKNNPVESESSDDDVSSFPSEFPHQIWAKRGKDKRPDARATDGNPSCQRSPFVEVMSDHDNRR